MKQIEMNDEELKSKDTLDDRMKLIVLRGGRTACR